MRGFGFWAVERKSDGAFVGRVGLWNPEGWPGLEVGWTLGRKYWGNGYATEAARAAMDHAFRTLDIPKLISVVNIENAPSQRVAKRLGERRGAASELTYGGKTFKVESWEIGREEWARAARA
jgi:RimJ/RimL family protein N-acetyltransferase